MLLAKGEESYHLANHKTCPWTWLQASSDTFYYESTDIVVKWNWTLSIPIEMPGSIVNYSFCTQQGDIDFGITFIPTATKEQGEDKDKGEAAEVLEEHRVPSEVEPISGVFRSPQEGAVRTLLWLHYTVCIFRTYISYTHPYIYIYLICDVVLCYMMMCCV